MAGVPAASGRSGGRQRREILSRSIVLASESGFIMREIGGR
jgi:hypothetical protein